MRPSVLTRRKYIQETIETGMPLVIVAILAGLALSNYWGNAPFWLRAFSSVLILLVAIFGFAMLGKPAGMASLEKDEE